MERVNGYSLSIDYLFDEMPKDKQEELYDFCEKFALDSKDENLENDEWKIVESETFQLKLKNKKDLKFYTVYIDEGKQMEEAWKEIAIEEEKYNTEVRRMNDRITKVIEAIRGKEFVKDILDCAEEIEVHGPWQIVRKTKGSYQKEEYNVIKGMWVDQWCNGGYVGDDFQGDVYIEIKKDRFLKMGYAC